MTETIRIADLPRFDAAELLDTDEEFAAYLTVVLEENDPDTFIQALGTVARAKGMTEIARATGLSRESLYKAFYPHSKSRFDTIVRVCKALGVKLVAQAA
jgi:probable addiction module antidote protein